MPSEWSAERVALVRGNLQREHPTITEVEVALFVEQCKRSGLDPLLKEAFCVARRHNAGTRERPQWVTRHEFQPSETGMLARAERFPDFCGVQASAVYADDEITLDLGAGEVVHRYSPTRRKGALVGAWARVVRANKLPLVVWLDFSGYAQTSVMWTRIPTTMLEKCARVSALRKAYPEAFGGLYIREEVREEEAHGGTARAPRQQAAKASRAEDEAQRKPPAEMDEAELGAEIGRLEHWAATHRQSRYLAQALERLQHLKDELQLRCAEREPGAEG